MSGDAIRLTQLRRMLGEPLADLAAAGEAVAREPERLARALVAEAAASDDVASVEAARAYVDARLVALADALPPGTPERVRAAADRALAAWT